MSIENARQLMARLNTDQAFRETIQAATPEERTALLGTYGFGDVTRADVAAAKASGELSDADMQSVAGGGPTDCWDPQPIWNPNDYIL